MNQDFFKSIKGFRRFEDLTDPAHYTPAPPAWYVVLTDVKNSTVAIAQNRYKDVNIVGASTITAVLNVAGGIDIPYVFGGDGTSMLIPSSLLPAARAALQSVQAKVKQALGIELRVGFVAVSALYERGAELKVGRFHLSPHVSQAVFQGNALTLAETWLKKGGGPIELCEAQGAEEPDLTGLECRWQPIENRNGSILNLLVRVTPTFATQALRIYADILREIEGIYKDYTQACPTYQAGMHLAFSPGRLGQEAKLRSRGALGQLRYLLRIIVLNAVGLFCLKTGKKAGEFDGGKYLAELVANSDARKFDEMLRMVIDSTPQQHEALERLLAARQQKGEITYGIHLSSHALMTCIVFNLAGNHVHFIDGIDGGYAMAAKQMKQQS